jgi:hypothetical protein
MKTAATVDICNQENARTDNLGIDATSHAPEPVEKLKGPQAAPLSKGRGRPPKKVRDATPPIVATR